MFTELRMGFLDPLMRCKGLHVRTQIMKAERIHLHSLLAIFGSIICGGMISIASGQEANKFYPRDFERLLLAHAGANNVISEERGDKSLGSRWHYGGFVDLGYLLDFNHPANRVFRSRGTTWHVDRPQINMAAFYLRKKGDEKSRWGVELTAQAGKDAEVFGFSATAPNIGGYKFLRQL